MTVTRRDSTEDILHGHVVRDSFRWLEKGDAPEVKEWVAAQNERTRATLGAGAGRDRIRERLSALLSVGSISVPVHRGGRLFYSRREGSMNQPVVRLRDEATGQDRALLDPNRLSAEGTTALDWSYVSPDGRRLAYGTSEGGSERSTLRIRDVETGADLPDVIPDTRACSVAWEPGGAGFFYTRYPAPGTVPAGDENYHRLVFHHRCGEDPARDPLLFGEGRADDDWPNVEISRDGRWLIVEESQGWNKSEVYLRDLRRGAAFVPVIEGSDALYSVQPLNDLLIVHTNEGASTYRVYTADPSAPGRSGWREVIPPAGDVLQSVGAYGGRLVAHYLHGACSRLRVFTIEGRLEREIALPGLGTVFSMSGEWNRPEFFYGFTSFTVAPKVFRFDLRTGSSSLWESVDSPIDESAFEIDQVWYPSRDGTPISMFVIHARGIRRDASHPCLLTGYGGFNVSLTPAFDRDAFLWFERGGVMAIPNLRGGGEYGEAWHEAGMLGKKQNVFDDFIAAAEFLVSQGYTRPERLAIQGGSNGGLLVGAALTQRPDLFRAVICAVPLLDMLRYHRFRIAKLWIHEYGSADDPGQFEWLHAYSPYHRVRDGVAYPAVLLMTAESDTRVDPMHARKMAARLQEATSAEGRPILLRTESRAGHGAGKPFAKQLDEQTDIYSFLFEQLGMSG